MGIDVYTLYVGQGNCSIVVGDSEAVIVDAHIPPASDELAANVKAQLANILRGKNLVGLMLTGFDKDHCHPQAVSWILHRYVPDWIMYPKYYKFSGVAGQVFKCIRAVEKARGDGRRPFRRIPIRLDLLENNTFDDLSSEWSVQVFAPHPDVMLSSNNSSLVAKLSWRGLRTFRYLATGDTETPSWQHINQAFGDDLDADVMSAPHHGSKNGICEETMALVRPEHVIVSAGVGNPYDHPHDEAIEIFEGFGAKVFSTSAGISLNTSWDLFGVHTEEWALP